MQLAIANTNIGSTDRLIRTIIGVVMIVGAVLGHSWAAGAIGAVLLGTAYLRFCPAYAVLGFRTNKDEAPASK